MCKLVVKFPLKDINALMRGDMGSLDTLAVMADNAGLDLEVVHALAPRLVNDTLELVDTLVSCC